jgi:hypothetical protein
MSAALPNKLIERLRRLLELSKSGNANEAANAAAAAQRLMTEHSISEAMLDESEESLGEIGDNELCADGAGARWRHHLAAGLTEANQCKAYVSRLGRAHRLMIVGHARNVATVRYLFAYVAREIERLCRDAGVGDRVFNNNFKLGAAITVSRRLRESVAAARDRARQQANASDAGGAALLRIDNALARIDGQKAGVDAWLADHIKIGKARKSAAERNAAALAAGLRAGHSIDLDGSRAVLGAGSERLRS